MMRAAFLCMFLATLATAHQESSSPSISIYEKSHNEGLIRFSKALKHFFAVLGTQNSLSGSPLQIIEKVPLYRLQASQAFTAFSQVTQQLGALLPPGQQQVLSIFSFVTGIAADLLKKDEQEQQYKDFLRFQAAQNQNKTFIINDRNHDYLIVSLALGAPALDVLLERSPELACMVLSKSLQNMSFLGDLAVSDMEHLSSSQQKIAQSALAEVTFSLGQLAVNHDSPSEFRSAQTVEGHRMIIHENMSHPFFNFQFLRDLFAYITQSTNQIIQSSLDQVKAVIVARKN